MSVFDSFSFFEWSFSFCIRNYILFQIHTYVARESIDSSINFILYSFKIATRFAAKHVSREKRIVNYATILRKFRI